MGMGLRDIFVAAWLVKAKLGSNLNSHLINRRLGILQPDFRILGRY